MSTRSFDLLGVPFDGESTLGWPGSRFAPARVRECIKWINMRIQEGQVYCLETDSFMHVGDQLLTDRGDIAVVPHDTRKPSAQPRRRSANRSRPDVYLSLSAVMTACCSRSRAASMTLCRAVSESSTLMRILT